MLSAIGILLVWGGCAFWGVRACVELRQRVRILEEIGQMLELVERELVLNATALPELMARMTHEKKLSCGGLISICSKELEKGNTFTCSWETAMTYSTIIRRDRQLLSGLAGVLGRYDAKGQVRALCRLREDWDEHIKLVRQQARSLGTIYGAIGMTAGGFLTLLLV